MFDMSSVVESFRTPLANTPEFRADFGKQLLSHTFVASSLHAPVLGLRIPPGQAITARQRFAELNSQAWFEMFRNLARWQSSGQNIDLPASERILVVGWHFPELPLILAWAKRARLLALVSQDAPWLEDLRQAGCTANFRMEADVQRLVAEMGHGRNIAAMLDHVYPDTEQVRANFLGRPARTPCGILKLGISLGYTLALVAPRGEKIQVVATAKAEGMDVAGLAGLVNGWIEKEIVARPERWLMWSALPYRFSQ